MSSSRMPCSAARPGFALAALAVLALAGCARQEAPRPAPAPVVPAVAALSPAIYFQLAANASLFAVRASELAEQRAASAGLRDAARSIAEDQKGIAGQLSFAGRRLDLLPSASLPPAMAADLEALRASGDFDADYRRLVGAALAQSLRAHAAFARDGNSPTLRPVAEMAAPATRRSLEALRR